MDGTSSTTEKQVTGDGLQGTGVEGGGREETVLWDVIE
jgi:hypothetical protein